MKRLSRYVLGQLFLPTLLGTLLFTFLFLMNGFFLIAQKAISLGLGWDLTFRLLLCELPKFVVMTIPMGTLLGTLIGIGRLSADHEWVAMQSAGLGPGSLLRPVFLHGLLAALVTLGIYAVVFPRTNYAALSLRREMTLSSSLGSDLRPRVFYTELPGVVLFVEEIRPGTQGRLEGVLIHRAKAEGGFDELILATEGDLYPAPDRPGGLDVDLRDVVLHAYRSEDPEDYRVFSFKNYHLELPTPPFLSLQARRNKTFLDMTPAELVRTIREAESEPEPVIRQLRVRRAWQELHQRFALPAAALLFAVLAVPLGITRVRSGKGAGFALAIMVIVVYWVVFTFTRDQGVQGRLPVPLGVWAANGVILSWIAFALWRLRRYRGGPSSPFGALFRRGAEWTRQMQRRPTGRKPRSQGERAANGDDLLSPAPRTDANRWISLVDRYISLQYLRMLGLALASTYVVYAIVELKGVLDDALQNRQPLGLVLAYLEYYTPGMFNLVLPISCLVGAVVAFTLMARAGELTAILASGLSMRRATVPVLIITLILCGVFFLVQNHITPQTNQKAQQVKDEILRRPPRSYGLSPGGRWTLGSEGRLYHYRLYDPAARRFQGLSVFNVDIRNPRIREHRFATTARWDGTLWTLGQSWYRDFPRAGDPGVERFEPGQAVALDPPGNFDRKELTLTAGGDLPEQMSLLELREQIATLRDSGYDTTRLEVDFHSKLAHPLTPLVMVLLGLPFAFRIGRRGSLYGVGVALLLVIVYWATFAVFTALGRELLLPPVLAAWASNILYSLLGVYLILHIRT